MARQRLDDEEGLMPRADAEEYHPTVRKRKSRCSCCGLKCWFFLFLLFTLMTTIVFYFIYPSVLQDNFQKLMHFACFYTTPEPIVCAVLATQYNSSRITTINATWGVGCTELYYIYTTADDDVTGDSPRTVQVKDIGSIEPLQAVDFSNPKNWMIFTDDTSYVAMDKLQGLLANKEVAQKFVMTDAEIQLPFLTTSSALQEIGRLNNGTSVSQSLSKAFKDAKITTSSLTFSGPNPISPDVDLVEIQNMTHAYVFKDVSVRDMHAFYLFSMASGHN